MCQPLFLGAVREETLCLSCHTEVAVGALGRDLCGRQGSGKAPRPRVSQLHLSPSSPTAPAPQLSLRQALAPHLPSRAEQHSPEPAAPVSLMTCGRGPVSCSLASWKPIPPPLSCSPLLCCPALTPWCFLPGASMRGGGERGEARKPTLISHSDLISELPYLYSTAPLG